MSNVEKHPCGCGLTYHNDDIEKASHSEACLIISRLRRTIDNAYHLLLKWNNEADHDERYIMDALQELSECTNLSNKN
jgi:hypothetical protein